MDEIKNLLIQIKEMLYDLKNFIKEYISAREIQEKEKEEENKAVIDMNKLLLKKNGTKVALTLSEAVILKELIKENEKLCTYEFLCNILYGYDLDESAMISIRTSVSRLKKKLEGLYRIKNIRNKGFIAYEVESDE